MRLYPSPGCRWHRRRVAVWGVYERPCDRDSLLLAQTDAREGRARSSNSNDVPSLAPCKPTTLNGVPPAVLRSSRADQDG